MRELLVAAGAGLEKIQMAIKGGVNPLDWLNPNFAYGAIHHRHKLPSAFYYSNERAKPWVPIPKCDPRTLRLLEAHAEDDDPTSKE